MIHNLIVKCYTIAELMKEHPKKEVGTLSLEFSHESAVLFVVASYSISITSWSRQQNYLTNNNVQQSCQPSELKP